MFLCYDCSGGYMQNIVSNQIDFHKKYKLYKSVYEIIHPAISKKNVSSYRIVLRDDLLPLLVFYPKKVSSLESIILFIPGDGEVSGCLNKYSDICHEISFQCDRLVIAIDYFDLERRFPDSLDMCYKTVLYLVDELEKLSVTSDNIIIMGDSIGANLISAMTIKALNENRRICSKEVLLYPVLSGEYFGNSSYESINDKSKIDLLTIERVRNFFEKYVNDKSDLNNPLVCPLCETNYKNFPDSMVITGDLDPLRDEGCEYAKRLIEDNPQSEYANILLVSHGFLGLDDIEMKGRLYQMIKNFILK